MVPYGYSPLLKQMRKKKIDIRKLIISGVKLAVIAAVVAGVIIGAPMVISAYRKSQAERAVADGRPERAIELLLPELERTPRDIELRLKIIGLYIQTNNFSRAEYLLFHGSLERAGQVELFRQMSYVFVMQDKLHEAVNLINDMSNPNIRNALLSERPPAPIFDPPPGDYREELTISVTVPEGHICYLSLIGEVPALSDVYKEPIRLPQGITEIRAVTISPQGLASDWSVVKFRLDDVIEPVIFEDAEIERIAREMLNMPTGIIISDRLQTITELIIPEPLDYKTLNDLRHFSRLETLKLVGNGTSADISALSYLSRLTTLSLTHFGIDSFSIEAIGQVYWLEHIDLSHNNIVLLEPLRYLTDLKTLVLNSNNILDLTPLEGLTKLQRLRLNQNAVESTRPLYGMTDLVELEMSHNLVSSLRGLASMTNLVLLDLSNNSIESREIGHLAGLSSLRSLDLSANRSLASLELLGDMSGLENLTANNCAITDLTGLEGLTGLVFLSLNDNLLESFEGIDNANLLKILWANKNEIATLQHIAQLEKLEELHIEHNKLPNLSRIRELPSIKKIYAFGNPITQTTTFREGVEVYVGR
jgi:Leucine-rich repeat (LRR) protein